MRMILALLFAAFYMVAMAPQHAVAGTYQGAENYVGTPAPAAVRLFAAFPNGGDGLAAAIRELLINNPTLADDVAYLASRGSPGQLAAAAAGMAEAASVLLARGNTSGAALIVTAAQSSGNATLALVVMNAVASSSGGGQLYTSATNSNPATTTATVTCTTVSPAGPATGC